jgi:hypothetical protein
VGANVDAMKFVKVEWIPSNAGGRKNPPPGGEYFAVAQFDEDKNWDGISWSVKFELEAPLLEGDVIVSYGRAGFLFLEAPQHKLSEKNIFFIYEGPKKVAKVISIPDV